MKRKLISFLSEGIRASGNDGEAPHTFKVCPRWVERVFHVLTVDLFENLVHQGSENIYMRVWLRICG
jgi:hypothetical protein